MLTVQRRFRKGWDYGAQISTWFCFDKIVHICKARERCETEKRRWTSVHIVATLPEMLQVCHQVCPARQPSFSYKSAIEGVLMHLSPSWCNKLRYDEWDRAEAYASLLIFSDRKRAKRQHNKLPYTRTHIYIYLSKWPEIRFSVTFSWSFRAHSLILLT